MPRRVFHSVEDLKSQMGSEIGRTDWIPIDQDRINKFAEATGDHGLPASRYH
jgi:acyl dehydratase